MDTAVSAVAAVVGSGAVDFHVSLSAMDVRADPNPNSNLNPNPNPDPNPDPKPNPNPTPNQVSLSAMDVQYAFVVAQGGGAHVHGGEEGAETIGFDEFATCVALCGHPNPSPIPTPTLTLTRCVALCGCVKYETVEQMSLAQRVAGTLCPSTLTHPAPRWPTLQTDVPTLQPGVPTLPPRVPTL